MELRQLEYFREIASTGSINEAARHLNMSQPPLSYQIRQLENELNVKLFDRTSKGVTLTEAGKLLYDRSVICWNTPDLPSSRSRKPGKNGSCVSV